MINWSWRWRQAEIDALKQGIKALDAHVQTLLSALDAAKSAGRDAQKSAMDWRDALLKANDERETANQQREEWRRKALGIK